MRIGLGERQQPVDKLWIVAQVIGFACDLDETFVRVQICNIFISTSQT